MKNGSMLHIDSSLPYIYLGTTYWESFSFWVELQYDDATCDSFTGICKFNKACFEFEDLSLTPLSLFVNDLYGNQEIISIPQKALLVEGLAFGDMETTCYIPVFQNKDDIDNVYIGQIMFDEYYVVFDQTPSTERNAFTNQIAWAPLNPAGIQDLATATGYVDPASGRIIKPLVPVDDTVNDPTRHNDAYKTFDKEIMWVLIACGSLIVVAIIVMCVIYHCCKAEDTHLSHSILEGNTEHTISMESNDDPMKMRIN